jgi:hypothetical protein
MLVESIFANVQAIQGLYSAYPGGTNPSHLLHQLFAQDQMIYGFAGPNTLTGGVTASASFTAGQEQVLLTMSPTGGGIADGATNMVYLSNPNVVNSPFSGGHIIVPSVPSPFIGFTTLCFGIVQVSCSATSNCFIRFALEGTTKTYGNNCSSGLPRTMVVFCVDFGTVQQTDTALSMLVTSSAACTVTFTNPMQFYICLGNTSTVNPGK